MATKFKTRHIEETLEIASASREPNRRGFRLADVLDEDTSHDAAFVTSGRRLGRLAVLAAETGARFVRDGIDQDPAAWLFAPRRLFGGRAAVDACQSREHFERAMLLHGLSLGLDAAPEAIDVLVSERAPVGRGGCGPTALRPDGEEGGPRWLFTAVVLESGKGGAVLAFYAHLAFSREAFEEHLRQRVGARLASIAHVRRGFDAACPQVAAIVPGPLFRLLSDIGDEPEHRRDVQVDVKLEQRFAF